MNVENKTLLSLIEAASSKEEEKISDENGEFLFNEANRSRQNTTYGLIDPYINTAKEESNSDLQNDVVYPISEKDVDSSPKIPIEHQKVSQKQELNVIYSVLLLRIQTVLDYLFNFKLYRLANPNPCSVIFCMSSVLKAYRVVRRRTSFARTSSISCQTK